MRALRVLRRHEDAIESGVASSVGAAVGAGSREGLERAARAAHAALDTAVARALAKGLAPACSPGCGFCCHVHVEVTGAELEAVAGFLERQAPEVRDAVVLRLEAHVLRARDMDPETRWAAKIPCALLTDDGRCGVYEARPLRCRSFHSTSRDACRDAYEAEGCEPHVEEPPSFRSLDRDCDAVDRGFEAALRGAGVHGTPVRLEGALLARLQHQADDPA